MRSDAELRALQRAAMTDPEAAERLSRLLKRIPEGPTPPNKPLPRRIRCDAKLAADTWDWGVKYFGKRIKSRAGRREAKEQCRYWEDY